MVVFSVALRRANETSYFSLSNGSSNSKLFLVEVKYRAGTSLKMAKICYTMLTYVRKVGNSFCKKGLCKNRGTFCLYLLESLLSES